MRRTSPHGADVRLAEVEAAVPMVEATVRRWGTASADKGYVVDS